TKDQPAHRPEPFPGQLEPDHEQQEGDAEFGQRTDLVGVGYGQPRQPGGGVGQPRQPVGPEQHPRREKAEHGADPETVEQRDHDARRGQEDHQILVFAAGAAVTCHPSPAPFSLQAETPSCPHFRRLMTKNSDDRPPARRRVWPDLPPGEVKSRDTLMKKLLIGAAVGALLVPAAPVMAQHFADDGHDHACVDEACTVFELFQAPEQGATVQGYQGIETPKYGTWGFDLNGRDTSVAPGDSFFRHANGAAFDAMQIPSDRTSYGSFALLREL